MTDRGIEALEKLEWKEVDESLMWAKAVLDGLTERETVVLAAAHYACSAGDRPADLAGRMRSWYREDFGVSDAEAALDTMLEWGMAHEIPKMDNACGRHGPAFEFDGAACAACGGRPKFAVDDGAHFVLSCHDCLQRAKADMSGSGRASLSEIDRAARCECGRPGAGAKTGLVLCAVPPRVADKSRASLREAAGMLAGYAGAAEARGRIRRATSAVADCGAGRARPA